MKSKSNISRLLPRGAVNEIAKELGVTHGTASAAIRRGHPGHPAVVLALKRAEASGALAAAQQLAKLTPVAQAA